MADKKPSGIVKYTMGPSTREITRQQWEGVGVKNQGTLKWDQHNNWSIPTSKVTAAALAILLEEKGFRVDEDSPAAPAPNGN